MSIESTNASKISFLIKIVFVNICVYFLVKFFRHPEHWINNEVSLLFTLEMLAISFPLSIIGWMAVWVLGMVLPDFSYWPVIEVFVFFFLTMLIGYWQWFFLLPSVWKRFRGKANSKK